MLDQGFWRMRVRTQPLGLTNSLPPLPGKAFQKAWPGGFGKYGGQVFVSPILPFSKKKKKMFKLYIFFTIVY